MQLKRKLLIIIRLVAFRSRSVISVKTCVKVAFITYRQRGMRVNPKVIFKVFQLLNVENTGCSIKEDNKIISSCIC